MICPSLTSDMHMYTPTHPHISPDYDCILHVNPYIEHRGLAMVFNPTLFPSVHNLSLPLYYTGITEKALVFHEGVGEGTEYLLNRDYTITVPFSMTPQSITWYLIKSID